MGDHVELQAHTHFAVLSCVHNVSNLNDAFFAATCGEIMFRVVVFSISIIDVERKLSPLFFFPKCVLTHPKLIGRGSSWLGQDMDVECLYICECVHAH